jgi:8-oxo-dGTP pyrophosphatase MutT (NUDIX family)
MAGIRRCLRDTLPRLADDDPVEEGRVAAVAAILRERNGDVELLFIRRATHRGDPWSGHMAWPGGKREPADPNRLGCAIRETREEIGIDLSEAGEPIGRLRGWQREGTDGVHRLRAVSAFVFVLTEDVEPRPGLEVQEVVWIPLRYFTSWKSRRPWTWVARWLPPVPPAFRYEGHLVWGLTQWMLSDLLHRVAGAGAPARVTP